MKISVSMDKDVETTDRPSEITFHFNKSKHFRVIHVDGAIGNLTPRGLIFVSLYSERGSLPDFIKQDVQPDGRLSSEQRPHIKSEGIMREMEVGLMVDMRTAKEIITWLTQLVNQGEQLIETIRAKEKEKDAENGN